jgi:hypothetical protein
MAKKSKNKKPASLKKQTVKNLKELARLIEETDTPMKILHAHASAQLTKNGADQKKP